MKYLFLFTLLSFHFFVSKSQSHYSDKNVEGYILNALLFKSKDYMNPNIKDIQCFESVLKTKTVSFYSDFYRQYSTKLIKGRKSLVVDMFKKTYFQNVSELKKPFVILDGCEDVRHIIFDIVTDKIVYDENGGGCN
ncbi:MAG: hypothetical protein H7Y86_13235 [Rhizobacter sp.]|nr:hypothetical protein [Ferruginibacter sp.]